MIKISKVLTTQTLKWWLAWGRRIIKLMFLSLPSVWQINWVKLNHPDHPKNFVNRRLYENDQNYTNILGLLVSNTLPIIKSCKPWCHLSTWINLEDSIEPCYPTCFKLLCHHLNWAFSISARITPLGLKCLFVWPTWLELHFCHLNREI